MRICLVLVSIILVTIVLGFVFREVPPREPWQAKPAVRVWSADSMIAELTDNPLRAESEMLGKQVVVYGKVESLGRELLHRPFMLFQVHGGAMLQCVFSDTTCLTRLSRGDPLVVTGRVNGASSAGYVFLDQCRAICD